MTTIFCLALVALAATAVACGDDSTDSRSSASSTAAESHAATGLSVVALGDSETTGAGDPTGLGWVERYARLLDSKLDVKSKVTNLAVDGQTSAELLAEVRSGPTTRKALEKAQVVLLGIGGADYNAADDDFAAGRCRAEACYAAAQKSFARNFDATVAAIRELRGSNKTALRSITQANALTGAEDVIPSFLKPVATRIGVYQAQTANRIICDVMAKYEGRCIDVLRAFNGPRATANAYKKGLLNHEDCCYANARGQQLMAELLLKTGLAPVQ